MVIREPVAALTQEEKAADKIAAATISHDGQGFQIGIPWSDGNQCPDVQCNFEVANRRLSSLMRMQERKLDVKVRYAAVLEDYLRKGYIRQVEDALPASSSQWYLPHFAVVRENKMITKVRTVWLTAQQRMDSIPASTSTGTPDQSYKTTCSMSFFDFAKIPWLLREISPRCSCRSS